MEIERRTREEVTEPLDVTGIKLLSVEEYKTAKTHIMPINGWWWLCSPGRKCYNATYISTSGLVDTYGNDINYMYGVVRPALLIQNLDSFNLKPNDKILDYAEHDWTVISDTMALCDDGIGTHCFREDWKAPNANDYEKSDVKRFIESWATENGIICEKKMEKQNEQSI